MFLADEQLKPLTGYKRPSEQRRWLSDHGWAFEVRADGKNRVLTEEARAKMLTRKTTSRSAEPNLEALRELA